MSAQSDLESGPAQTGQTLTPNNIYLESMNKVLTCLQSCEVLSCLPESELEHLTTHLITRKYKKNTIIISSGDVTDSVYIIQSGKVKVYRDNEEGRQITFNTLLPGTMFGELAALAGTPRAATVETAEPTVCLVLTKSEFVSMLERNPSVAVSMSRRFAQLVHLMSNHMADIALLDVYGRLTNFLERNVLEIDGKQMVAGFTHQEMANHIGSSREVISRMLGGLKQGGYISSNRDSRAIVLEKKLPPGL
ncbi:MAG: Crp/Fnr family transcriptional regulator [Nitrospinae bacterium]|nr:Crp/Fnr family transcriptional regulator [Nitrospinota bacterium]